MKNDKRRQVVQNIIKTITFPNPISILQNSGGENNTKKKKQRKGYGK